MTLLVASSLLIRSADRLGECNIYEWEPKDISRLLPACGGLKVSKQSLHGGQQEAEDTPTVVGLVEYDWSEGLDKFAV